MAPAAAKPVDVSEVNRSWPRLVPCILALAACARWRRTEVSCGGHVAGDGRRIGSGPHPVLLDSILHGIGGDILAESASTKLPFEWEGVSLCRRLLRYDRITLVGDDTFAVTLTDGSGAGWSY
jgi:hypothetical protein